jgi:hypothetical protein
MTGMPTPAHWRLSAALSLLSWACAQSPPPAAPEPGPNLGAPEPAPAPATSAQPADDVEGFGPVESAEPAQSERSDSDAEPVAAPETRTNEVIAKIIKDNRKPFRDCFEKGLDQVPELQGTMTLHFVLTPGGKVKLAELNEPRSDIKLPLVVDCALAVLRSMTFPRSSRGMESTVNYPFVFNN